MDEKPETAKETLPAPRLDRGAVERVLKRAVELHATDHGGVDGLDETQLADVAQELGIAPQHLRRALAEERAGLGGPGTEPTFAEKLLGPSQLTVGRVVRGAPRPLLETGMAWLEGQEALRISRRMPEGLAAEPDHRALARLRSGLGIARGTGHLRKADAVTLRVEALDGAETFVTAAADLASSRTRAIRGVVATAIIAVLAAAMATGPLGVLAWVMAISLVAGIAAAWRAELRRQTLQVRRGLERALDALEEAGPLQPRLETRVSGALDGARKLGEHIRLLGEAIRDGLRPPK